MKYVKRILIGLISLLIVISIGVLIFLQLQSPIYNGELKLDGLKEPVEIYFDDFGVPHIYAQHKEDAYFALGYVHAQDRLFQMEMLRRAAGGRLSEVLGKDLLEVDRLFRTLSLNKFAREHAQRFFSTDTSSFQKASIAYQKGVNQFIATGKTPLEFLIIGIPKTDFTPEDIYLAVGFMSFGFAEGLQADPVLQKIKTEQGDEYLKDLAVETPVDAERIKNYDVFQEVLSNKLVASIRHSIDKLPVPLWQGSNGWVIAGSRTESGFPILANDTHMQLAQPTVWYEAHIEYPGFSFYGHHLAGIPFGVLGNNKKVVWGLTMFENDDTDFFIETTNTDSTHTLFKEQWEPILERKEIIKVKDEADVILTVKSTRHGPIINSIVQNTTSSNPIALSWQLLIQENKTLQAAHLLNHATNFNDAEKAASMFNTPGLNVMYGDTDGNIAWWASARLPVRPQHVQSKLFLDGASGADEYLGYYDFSKNPHAINPPWGFVYSSNNQPDSVDGVLYPGYYYPKTRAQRIVTLLSNEKIWTIDDVKKINLDVISVDHAHVGKEIADVLSRSGNEKHTSLIEILRIWDGDHQLNSIGPSVYYNLLANIMEMAMKDELGEEAYASLMETSIPKNSYLTFISNDSSPWWDNVATTDSKETRADIFSTAAEKAIINLHKLGKNPEDWSWQKIHQIEYDHPLGSVKPLNVLFNVGPIPVPGGSEVINNLFFNLNTDGIFSVTGGPSLRKITDLSDIENGITVSPTGQSGNVMSAHYDDQAEMYATGQFRKMKMNKEEIIKNNNSKLVLKPIE